ncbi:MAG: hypothetical protein WDM96_06480 [Lacunisphaera sp.]
MSVSPPRRFVRLLLLAGLLLAGLGLSGCGLFRADAVVGPDLKPRVGTSVSLPIGK